MNIKRLLVCGSRYWTDKQFIADVLNYHKPEVVIEGGCRGADRLSAVVARQLNIRVEEYPADWEQHGKAAGPIRNQQMLDEGKPDLVVALHDDWVSSKGTKDMINRAFAAGVPVSICQHPQYIADF